MYKPNYKFVGSNYIDGLSTKEIAKLVRAELKKQFPKCKFSITTEYNNITCYLLQAPFEGVKPVDMEKVENIYYNNNPYNETKEIIKERWELQYKRQQTNINKFHIEKNKYLTDEAKHVLQTAKDLVNSYNYDDSDSMTDYFCVNFYYDIDLGKWNKPFQVIK